jgi:hypothetical protein
MMRARRFARARQERQAAATVRPLWRVHAERSDA